MSASLYDDDVLDGTPLADTTSSNASDVPMVGLRVTANWAGSDADYPGVYGPGHVNTSMKLMQSHMAAKRAQGRPSGSQWSSRPTSVAPVVDLNQRSSTAEGTYRFNPQTGRLERVNSSRLRVSSPTMSSGGLMFGEQILPLGVADEYDPLVPNDYEELARIKREKRRAEEAEISARDGRRAGFSDDDDADEDDDDEDFTTAAFGRSRRPPPPPSSKGAAIAPPAALVDEDQGPDASTPDISEEEALGYKFGINPLAAKMMARMGYREGQGLGRESQGMSTALVVEKTSRRGGKIIHEKDQQRSQQHQQQPPLPMGDAEDMITELPLPENRSCVILLRNMCGPGEVDDDLEPETAEECAKYGKVVTCMIFELPEAADDEAVRIFVEFETEEAATKAILDLNGRFFAGRVVKAGFYDAEKFRNLELSDQPITA